jgi:hypothetical protein
MLKVLGLCVLLAVAAAVKEIEKCLLDQIKGFESDYLYLMDHDIIQTIAADFHFLPKHFQEAMLACIGSVQEYECERVHGLGKCERCGLVKVPKCEPGFIRVDCGICAKKCPDETMPDAGGLLCLKPRIERRETHDDRMSCQKSSQSDTCEQVGRFWVRPCPKNYVVLAGLMCEYKCPESEGFEGEGIYCVPPVKEINRYFLNVKTGKLKYNPKKKAFE